MSDVIPLEEEDSFYSLFVTIYQNNYEAINVSMCLVKVLHTWDDLIDLDKEVNDENINNAFMDALVEIGTSPLWDKEVAGLFRSVYYKWKAACAVEDNKEAPDESKRLAYVARAGFYDIFYHFAYRVGGRKWAEEMSPIILQWYGENYDDYCKEFWG